MDAWWGGCCWARGLLTTPPCSFLCLENIKCTLTWVDESNGPPCGHQPTSPVVSIRLVLFYFPSVRNNGLYEEELEYIMSFKPDSRCKHGPLYWVYFSRNIKIESKHQFQIRYILFRNFASINLLKISSPLLASALRTEGKSYSWSLCFKGKEKTSVRPR